MKKGPLIIIIILIFILSIAVRYWPVLHKDYSCSIGVVELILARNLSLTDEYKITDEKDIILSSSLIKERGVPSNRENKLTPVLYSKIFDIFGFNQNTPLYISLFFYALTTVLLFLLVLKLFNLKLALIFVGIDIFMPFVLSGAIWFGAYEWAMFFFVIALLIYLWKEKPGNWRLLLSGLFFGLAALARNAFLISFIPFVFYDFYFNFVYKKNWKKVRLWLSPAIKRIFIFALPVILLWGGYMVHNYLEGTAIIHLTHGDLGYDGHLFRDSYTYHFDKDNYIKEIQGTSDGERISYLKKYDYDISWKQHLTIYFYSIKYYLSVLFRQPTIGGPLMIFLLILGAIYLFKTRKHLLALIAFWFVILFFILIFVFETSNEVHFLEIRFPLVLLISLGIYWTASWLRQAIKSRGAYYWLIVGVFLVLFIHLIQSDKWLFHEKYLYSGMSENLSMVESVNKSDIKIEPSDVIAAGGSSAFILNYYTDFSYIYFSPDTIKKLLKENKLQWAFDQFGVTRVVNYSRNLTEEIIRATNTESLGFSP